MSATLLDGFPTARDHVALRPAATSLGHLPRSGAAFHTTSGLRPIR